MSRAQRDYGSQARTVIQYALTRRWCTQESYACYLSACCGESVDRSLVAQWATGATHPPGDALLRLMEHVGPEHGAELADVYLRGADLGGARLAVQVTTPEPARPEEAGLQALVAAGELVRGTAAALEDGRLDPEEAEGLDDTARRLGLALDALRGGIDRRRGHR